MKASNPLSLGLLAALVGGMLTACPASKTPPGASSAQLLSQAKSQLAERERKVSAYRISGQAIDLASGQHLGFTFVFHSPNQMRGETLGAAPRIFAFDGKVLSELAVNEKKLTHYDLSALPPAKADAFLHNVFAPFSPEGFRAPLLPTGKTVEAKLVTAGAGKPELQLDSTLVDGKDAYRFAFHFASPGMDLLRKEVSGPQGTTLTEVTRQHCDEATKLCFPQVLLETRDGKPSARTELDAIAINGPIAEGEFTLGVPDGGVEETKHLAASGK